MIAESELTLGIDLASQPYSTAMCTLRWSKGRAEVVQVVRGVDDSSIVEQAAGVAATGIDAPFGWPDAFVRRMASHHDVMARHPRRNEEWTDEARDLLRFRETDRQVRDVLGRWPLSVSSDQIALPALRCIGILERLGVEDRSGDGRVFEVYPAVALHRWGLPSSGYKISRGRGLVDGTLDALLAAAPWLELDEDDRDAVIGCHDCFDALVAALTARVASLGLFDSVPGEHVATAAREGWIVIPLPGSLAHLCR